MPPRVGAPRLVWGAALLRGWPSRLRCRAMSPGWRPRRQRWRAVTEAGQGVGVGPVATRWRYPPASSTRAGVMTSRTPTPLSMPLGRRWPWVLRELSDRSQLPWDLPSLHSEGEGSPDLLHDLELSLARFDLGPALNTSWSPVGLGCHSASWPMSDGTEGPSEGWGGATPSMPFKSCTPGWPVEGEDTGRIWLEDGRGMPGPVEGASDLQVLVWCPSDCRHLRA